MKKLLLCFPVLVLLWGVTGAHGGTTTANQFIYKPHMGAGGVGEKALFDAGLDKVDAHLGKYKTLGDPGYETLSAALGAIGSNQVTLAVSAGAVAIAGNTTIPANVHLDVKKGGDLQVANGATLTINGAFTAGAYKVFSCTGTGKVVFGNGALPQVHVEWWGAAADDATDSADAINAALAAHQVVKLLHGTYYISKTLLVPANRKLLGTVMNGGVSGTYLRAATSGTWIGGWILAYNTMDGTNWVQPYPMPGAIISDLQLGFAGSTNATGGLIAIGGGLDVEHVHFGGLKNGIRIGGINSDQIRIRRCVFNSNGSSSDYDIATWSLGDGLILEGNHHSALVGGNGGILLAYRTGGSMKDCIANCAISLQYCYGFTLQNLHMEQGGSGTPTIDLNTCHATVRDVFMWKRNDGPAITVTYTANGSEGTVILDNVLFMVRADIDYATEVADVNYTYGSVVIRDCARVFHDLGEVTKKNRCGIKVNMLGSPLAGFNKYSHFYSLSSTLGSTRVYGRKEAPGITNTGGFSWSGLSGTRWKAASGTYYYDAAVLLCPDRLAGKANSGAASSGIARTQNGSGEVYVACSTDFPAIVRLYRGTSAGSYDKYVDVPMLGGEWLYDFGNHVMGYTWLSRSAGPKDSVANVDQFILHGSFAEIWAAVVPAAGSWTRGDRWWTSTPAASASPGSICVTAGTPGTWKAMANLAP